MLMVRSKTGKLLELSAFYNRGDCPFHCLIVAKIEMIKNIVTGELLGSSIYHDPFDYPFNGLIIAKNEDDYAGLIEFLHNPEDYEFVRVELKVVEFIGPVVPG